MTEAIPTTPLLEQYEGVKARYPGHLVLFQVGDFFETFGDDAKLVARELDVVLTARGADARGERTPMAGVPRHAVETYLGRLVRKGYKVALCEQVEEPRDAKGPVRREVTRVVTPGTVVEDGLIGGPEHNFLAVVRADEGSPGAVAAVDLSTGEWYRSGASSPGLEPLAAALAPFAPREILYSAASPDDAGRLVRLLRSEAPQARLEPAPTPMGEAELPAGIRPGRPLAPSAGLADRILAAYVRAGQPRLLPFLSSADRGAEVARLALDAKTLRHLEISRPMNPDDPSGETLVANWDETVTAPGRRTLSFWLRTPLAEPEPIAARQEAVAALAARGAALESLRRSLAGVPDLARIASRIASRRARPPELGALREGLRALERMRSAEIAPSDPPLLRRLGEALEAPAGLLARLEEALPDRLPLAESDGGLFRRGHAPTVDRWVEEERGGLADLEALERAEREASGVRTLKVGYNQVFGYYFEVGRAHSARVPAHFRRRQTIAQAERYTSDRLEEIAHRVLEARDRIREEEAGLWERLLAEVDAVVPAIHRIGRAVGALDALASFARVAERRRCVRPTIDRSGVITLRASRHPVLDRLLGERYVPNDVELDRETSRLLVLTGPNMSGKSTYMRQIGLTVVLAQAGAFVPAQFARIGLVTGLYTRMGFTDEIGRGKSSFMVEMTEVAEILSRADENALVLLDEVGRGTSTFDGLAVAWATIRYLHDVTRCRCVLATHYHQLSELVEGLAAARQAHLAIQERPEGIVFLHHLVPGSTDQSYGLHVARLAGLPRGVLDEADRLLRRLEGEGVELSKGSRTPPTRRYTQGVLLTAADAPPPSAVERSLREIDVERLTPIEALTTLAELKRRLPPHEGRSEPP